jgi:hypothetical protein
MVLAPIGTGASDRISEELSKLSIHEKYQGRDLSKLQMVISMHISNIGLLVLRTPLLYISIILHVSHACKKLLSFHKLSLDNN